MRLKPLIGSLLVVGGCTVDIYSAETWYLRDSAGDPNCTTGDNEAQNQTAGSSVVTKVLDVTGDSWDQVGIESKPLCEVSPQVIGKSAQTSR